MLTYSSDDVVQALGVSKNLNAALKSFLRREVKKGDPAEKFVKELRATLIDKDGRDPEKLLARYMPDLENHLIVIAAYAHHDFVNAISQEIVGEYGEAFNKTYTSNGETITITNRPEFERIIREVAKRLKERSETLGLTGNPFFLNVMLNTIFERPLMRDIVPLVSH
jgi:hypothetical protein